MPSQGEIVIGIDPGTVRCGYGIVRNNGDTCLYLKSGVIRADHRLPLHKRLKIIYDGLTEVISQYSPHVAVVEKVFIKGIRASMGLGYSRGVALLAIANNNIPVYEYSPLEVKKAVTGYGRAEKNQIQKMVRLILGLQSIPSEDSADALALCICYTNNQLLRRLLR